MRKVLLTAFGPFGEWDENASWLALQSLMRDAPSGVELTTRRYPVDFRGLRERLAADLVTPFDAVLCLGQAAGAGAVRLEGFALNVAREHDGEVDHARELEPGGPIAYRSSLPLADWARMLAFEGVPAKVSLHAGDYLCNAALYWSHYFTEQSGAVPRVAFVHLPLDLLQAARTDREQPSMPAEISGFAVRRLLESIASLPETPLASAREDLAPSEASREEA